MTNPLTNAYDKFDDFMMASANIGVRGWNNVFGGTKADLANVILSASEVVCVLGGIVTLCEANRIPHGYNYVISPTIPVLMGCCIHKDQKENKLVETMEVDSVNSSLKNLIVEENYKERKNLISPVRFGISGSLSFLSCPFDSVGSVIMGVGVGISSFSDYVMRAEYLPPKKSIFLRAKDKLVDMISEIRAPVPQPVPVQVKYHSDIMNSGGELR